MTGIKVFNGLSAELNDPINEATNLIKLRETRGAEVPEDIGEQIEAAFEQFKAAAKQLDDDGLEEARLKVPGMFLGHLREVVLENAEFEEAERMNLIRDVQDLIKNTTDETLDDDRGRFAELSDALEANFRRIRPDHRKAVCEELPRSVRSIMQDILREDGVWPGVTVEPLTL